MKVVVGALGLSPPVVTTPLILIEGIRKLVVFTTQEEGVKQGYELIKLALRHEYPKVALERVELEFSDVGSEEENFEFMRIAGRIIRAEKEKNRVVYVNLAGGRKNMSLSLALIAQMLNARMFHIIRKEVKSYNLLLENLRNDIKQIYEAYDGEKDKIYTEKRDYFRELLFPRDANLVRIPAIPLPQDYLKRVVEALSWKKVDMLTAQERDALIEAGLMEKIGRKAEVSELGKKLGEVLTR